MKSRGFTIVELLIFMGILAGFLTVLAGILSSALDLHLESAATSSVDQAAAYLQARLQYDIHRAQGLTTPSAPGQTSSTLVMTVGGTTYTYAVNSSVLELTTDLGTDLLTDSAVAVSGFSVTRLGTGDPTDTLRVSLTLTSLTTTLSDIAQTRQLQFTVSPR